MTKLKLIAYLFLVFLLVPNLAFAESKYGSIDVYYNEKLLPGKEVAKPTLDIGEPFKVKINLTVYQKSDAYVSLSCMEKSSFEIVDGPTLKIEDYSNGDILEINSSKEYEWIVKPTERWKGGSIPLDIYYTILAHGDSEPLAEGGFTVAYCTISNEYYAGEIPTSEDHLVSETEPSPKSVSTPAFSLLAAVLALIFAFFRIFHR